MQEDSKTVANEEARKEISATDRDEAVARITAELLGKTRPKQGQSKDVFLPTVLEPTTKDVSETPAVDELKTESNKAQVQIKPVAGNSVLQKEISSAEPDKSVSIAQSVAKNILQTDDGVRPFQQGDDKFRAFFTTTAVVLPKEMTEQSDESEENAQETLKQKKSIFSWFANRRKVQPELEEDDEEDESVFFPEEVAVRSAFVTPSKPVEQEPVDETVQFDLFALQQDPAPTATASSEPTSPKGSVRFLQDDAQSVPQQVVEQPTVPEIIFDDVSDEDTGLQQETEMQTAPKENFFAAMFSRVQNVKASVQAQQQAKKEARLQAQQAEEAEQDAAQAQADLLEQQELATTVISQEDTLLQTDDTLASLDLHEVDEATAINTPLAAQPTDGDAMFASLQNAFAARGGVKPATETAPLQDDFFAVSLVEPTEETVVVEPLAMDEVANQEEVAVTVPEEVAAEEVATIALDAVAIQDEATANIPNEATAQDEVAAAVLDEAVAEDEVAAIVLDEVVAEENVSEQVLDETIVQAITEEVAPSYEKPNYCLFSQEDDERAALEQVGRISFYPAPTEPSATRLFDQDQAQVQDESDDIPSLHLEEIDSPEMLAAVGAVMAAQDQPDASDFFAPEETQPVEVASSDTQIETIGLLDAQDLAELGEATAQSSAPFEDTPLRTVAEKEPLPEDPEGIQFGLHGMRAKLMLRTFITGVFAIALFLLGLMGQGVLPVVDAIDPSSAPVPFLLVNLLLLLLSAGISYPIFIDGVSGLWKKPSPDTLPALAASAALLQLLIALMLVDQFDAAEITVFAAVAGIVLFADAFGSLVMAFVIQHNFERAVAGVPHHLAYLVAKKDTRRTLTRGVDVDHPSLLVSRPVQQIESFLEKSFSPHESDQRAQWLAYGVLGGGSVAFLISLLKDAGLLGAISSFAAVLCIGAPLSITLITALPSLFMQRAASRVGAMVPGWQSVETLGEINLVAVDAKELFPPLCAQLYGIKTFQKERVDLAILYATSILLESCDTLHGLFAGMIEHNENMLYPVKDLERRHGLGFIGWCENYRVILGTRTLMMAEGVPLPALDYEERFSKNGKRQVLYLSVSGQLYAMFLIGYRGEKSIARSLRTLRKANIHLLVNSSDPTLTAKRIEAAYRLPEGFVTLLAQDQATALTLATEYRPKADGCMMHLGNFASFVGGLKAALGAAGAERGASAIQLVSVVFSILLSLFLCVTGGLMQVALVAILLYQISWSVLTLGIVLTKKFE